MRLNVLGPLELIAGGRPVPLGPPKQRALLALLLVGAGRLVEVDVLVDRLWSGRPPANAVGNLQVYISNLRKALEPDRLPGAEASTLVSWPSGYLLVTDQLSLDARDLEEHLRVGQRELAAGRAGPARDVLTAAWRLSRGRPYADVADEDWARPEVARLEQLLHDTTECLAAACLAAGDTTAVVDLLEPFVHEHPLRERAWEQLVLAHYRAGRQGAALECLRRVRRVLADELGVDPGPRLKDLETAVLRQDPNLEAATAPAVVARGDARSGPDGWTGPFVGRTEALAALADAFTSSAEAGQVVLVDGDPGIGKTTLVRRFCSTVPVPTVWGRSPDHETAPPLWPWEQVLRHLVSDGDTAPPEVARLLRDGAGTGTDAPGARVRFAEQVRQMLADQAPLVVVLDDLHAADEASVALLAYLAGVMPPGLLVVATYRAHEASGLTHVLSSLARHGARRVSLLGLDPEETAALVHDLAGDVEVARVEEISRRSGGNPFFVTELARTGEELPAAVRDVLRDRVDGLDESVAAFLHVAAVVGDEFDALLVADAAGRSVDEAVALLDRAREVGLVQDVSGRVGRYRFSHALVIDALLWSHSPLWRARQHERVAEALGRLGARDDRTTDLARHWLAAAELGSAQARLAVEHAARAARLALARHAAADATLFWQDAAAAAELAGLATRERFDLALGLTEAHFAAGRYEEGYDAAVLALESAGDDPDRVVRVADAAMRTGIWTPFRYGTDPVPLRLALEEAVPALPAGSPTWALGQACRAVVQAQTARLDEVAATSAAAVSAAEASGDPGLAGRVLHLRLVSLRGAPFLRERMQTAEAMLAHDDLAPDLRVGARMHVVSRLTELGRVPEALAELGRVDAELGELRDPALLVQLAIMHGCFEIFRGDPASAAERISTLDPLLSAADRGYFEVGLAGQSLEVPFEQGRLAAEVPMLETLYARRPLQGFGLALGLALDEAGETGRAREMLAQVTMPPPDYTWVSCAVTRTHLALRLGALDVVEEMYDALTPYAGELAVNGTCSAIMGAWSGHLGEASLALGRPDRARDELAAAVDLLDRNGPSYWLTRSRQALAKCT